LGESGLEIYKKIFDNNSEEKRKKFFKDDLIRALFYKIEIPESCIKI